MLNIHIKTIPDTEQRYDTVGDYKTDADGKLQITVSDMTDPRYEFLIAVHEMVESYLCQLRGVSEQEIDEFDIAYEESRAVGETASEPGNDPKAPYHLEHLFATKIEKMMAEEMGVDWDAYSAACASLTQN